MKLENQVVSLDLSKRLKELGFKQDSLFYYSRSYSKMMMEEGLFQLLDKDHAFICCSGADYKLETISAYTVAELGEMLPGELYFKENNSYAFLEMIKTDDDSYGYYYEHITGYETPYPKICDNEYLSETEADARAKMLIYLKENNLI